MPSVWKELGALPDLPEPFILLVLLSVFSKKKHAKSKRPSMASCRHWLLPSTSFTKREELSVTPWNSAMIVLPHFVWLGVAATKAKLRQRGTLTNLTTLGGWLQSPSNIFKLKSQLLFLHIFWHILDMDMLPSPDLLHHLQLGAARSKFQAMHPSLGVVHHLCSQGQPHRAWTRGNNHQRFPTITS